MLHARDGVSVVLGLQVASFACTCVQTLVFKPCMQTLSDIATTMLRAHLSSVSVLYASARGDDMSVRLSVSTATGAAGLAVASAVAESC